MHPCALGGLVAAVLEGLKVKLLQIFSNFVSALRFHEMDWLLLVIVSIDGLTKKWLLVRYQQGTKQMKVHQNWSVQDDLRNGTLTIDAI